MVTHTDCDLYRIYLLELILLKIRENNFVISKELKELISDEIDGDYIQKTETRMNSYKKRCNEFWEK